ncbi:unnamed protein product [Owenia fusiformis]|uniref:Uncharacterized protein n=1 Tax=Owenia fusiformis TaxID=6347 RepID=A0A8J1YB13_OWEFU|nr:unnamed protein product [Owenia fusiformis]
MAMNYVGNIAILDRGDAPAQVVIDKNARSLAQRVADDTREELDRVMGRVEHIYDDLDAADKLQQNTRLSSMEYLSDVFELEELLKDQVKKKKYQQQVTVFVIGFQNVAGTKLKLLQQVNDFFMDSSQQMEEEDLATPTPEFNLDEVAENMASTIDTAQDLSKKLGEINHEMVEYLTSVSATKAGNRGKRKLEKALGAAKEDIQKLTDNLLAAQQELEDREEKMQQLFKQIEGKSMEVNKFKTAAEVARKAAAEADLLQDELEKRDKRITEMRRKIADLELEVGQVSYSREQTQGRMSKANTHGKEKIESLQTALDDKINELAINKKELQNLHEQQTEELTKDHAETIEKMKQDHAEEIRKLMEEMQEVEEHVNKMSFEKSSDVDALIKEKEKAMEEMFESKMEDARKQLEKEIKAAAPPEPKAKKGGKKKGKEEPKKDPKATAEAQAALAKLLNANKPPTPATPAEGSMIEQNKESSRNTSRAESRPKPGSRGSNKGKSPSRPNTKSSSVSPARKPQRSKSEIATQDDGDGPNSGQVVRGPPTRGSQQHTNLDTVDEDYDINVEDLPDILNEDAWAVPKTPQDLKLKYAQHRLLSKHKLAELGDDVEAANATTQRKVKTLKVQFQEHKAKWSKEREILIEQIEQLQKLQNEAEHEADEAMNQLETFIDEQEKLEKEEEKLRDHVMSRSGMTKISLDEAKSSLQTTLDANAKSDLDLQERLMQQTDDAKAEEMANKLANLGRVKSEPEVKASPTEEEELQRSKTEPPGGILKSDLNVKDLKISRKAVSFVEEPKSKTPSEPEQPPVNIEPEEEDDLAPEQIQALKEVREMMDESKMAAETFTVLTKLRTDLQTTNEDEQGLSDEQWMRTATIMTMSTRVAKEATILGLSPEGVFYSFARINPKDGITQESLKNVDFTQKALPQLDPQYIKMKSAMESELETELTGLTGLTGVSGPGMVAGNFDAVSISSRSIPMSAGTTRSITRPQISGTNEDEIRASSVLSRVSLRDQFKNHLDAQRSMTAERRSNTPAIDVESYKSTVLNEELDENADIPFTEEEGTATMSFHKGTSPPPGSTMMSSSQHAPSLHSKASSRKSLSIAEHPVVNEYIKTYDVVINFKDTLSKLFLDKDMMSLAEILADLDPVMFNREIKVQPQIEMMTSSVLKVLEEITSLISSILFNDRDYNVSSLLNVSRDPTRTLDAGSTHGSLKSGKSVATTDDVRELRDAYFEIEKRLEEQRRRYEEQNSHNTVLMMEMQDTINQLQREISTIDKERQDQKEATSSPEPSIMFTRLDVERNTKVIKRAGDEGRLPNAVIQDAVKNMEDYSSLPARRLVHLVQKYVHHCQMKDIEENVRKSRSLNDNVFMILDKMESLQNKRAQKWADRMDEMGSERLRLANLLMETLNGIEQESGIFLIKPMYSYKARALTDKYQAKVSQKAYRPPRELSPLPGHGRHSQQSHLAPAPTPSSNARGYNKSDKVMSEERKASPDDPGAGILGAAPNWVGEQPTSSWNPGASEAAELPDEHLFRINNLMNTPKILEMDVNRMLIGQNNISAKIIGGSPTSIASNLRSYVSVQRQPQNGPIKKDHLRPKSTGGIDSSAAPPTTPMRDSLPQSAASMKRARFSDMDGHVSKSLPNTPPPLPPITRQSTKSSDLPVPPASPPGSSLRQSPPIMNDDDDIIPSHVTKVIATSSKGELTLDNMNPET